jgi:hypothetical protein
VRACLQRLALCALCLVPALPAFAQLSPLELFEEGNRLYRDELYWAALLRYRQAAEAGLSTPILHYNTGVAHYRARQYDRARDALLKSLDSPDLRVAAQHNLGLTEYAAGNNAEALRWFRLVRDQQQNPKLSAYATEAIARIRTDELAGVEEVVVETPTRDLDEPVARFEFQAAAGFGTDSNVYRSPGRPYTDYSNPAAPTVDPVTWSGAYIPFHLGARYRVDAYENEYFYAAYKLRGVAYQDVALNNADEYAQELSVGSEYRTYDKERERGSEVYSAFSIATHQETYFDPDDGSYFLIIDEDGEIQELQTRMDYVRYGPELNFRQRFSDITFGLGFKGQLWNYENEEVVPEYDHEYLILSGFAQYHFFESSLIRLGIQGSLRNFGDRPAYDLNGDALTTNPDLEYQYLDVELTARQRITSRMWFGLEYLYSERTDKFVGYNDYIRDQYGANFRWHIGYRFDLDLSGIYMLYDFPRAFAFDNPEQARKSLERVDFRATGTFRLTEHLFVIGGINFVDSASNDTRIDFDRAQYSIAVRWAM